MVSLNQFSLVIKAVKRDNRCREYLIIMLVPFKQCDQMVHLKIAIHFDRKIPRNCQKWQNFVESSQIAYVPATRPTPGADPINKI